MYKYMICNMADEEIFQKQCTAIESHISPLEKKKLLIDVDGSKMQIYVHKGKEIVVYNDYYMGDVHIDSEIELQQFFKKPAGT